MAKDPLKPDLNRARQTKTDSQFQKIGVSVEDVDMAIAIHMIDTIVPTVEVMGENVKIPVLYGNPERWKAVKRDGYYRDKKGQVQLPLIMFKRTSIEPNDELTGASNRNLTYTAQSRYSSKHKYDLFSQMTGATRPLEQYNITMPDYVTVSYDVQIWTDFTQHMNDIVQAFQYASDTYWGEKKGLKFKTKVDSFQDATELSEGTQRIVSTTFGLSVNAYLLPEKFDNTPTTSKAFTIKRVVWDVNTNS